MDGKKKMGIMALLGSPSGDEGDSEGDDMAIKALYKAISEQDEAGFAEAFRAAVDSCEYKESEQEEE